MTEVIRRVVVKFDDGSQFDASSDDIIRLVREVKQIAEMRGDWVITRPGIIERGIPDELPI